MGGKGKTTFQKVLQKVTHQSDASPIGLKKYGLVIVGGHMGGILTRHFEQYDHGRLGLIRSHYHFCCFRLQQKCTVLPETYLREPDYY
jgi:hypothetical protein